MTSNDMRNEPFLRRVTVPIVSRPLPGLILLVVVAIVALHVPCALWPLVPIALLIVAGVVTSCRWLPLWCVLAVMFVYVGMEGCAHGLLHMFGLLVLSWAVSATCAAKAGPRSTWEMRSVGLWFCCALGIPLTMFAASFVNARSFAGLSCEKRHVTELGLALCDYADHHDGNYPDERNWGTTTKTYLHVPDSERYPDLSKRPVHDSGGEAAPPPEGDYIYIKPRQDCPPDRTVMLKAPGWEDRLGYELVVYVSGRVEARRVWPWWRYMWEGSFYGP